MGWPWSRWRCMDNWVLLVHPWKTVGMVSLVLGHQVPRVETVGRVCPGNSPLGAWVNSVLEQKRTKGKIPANSFSIQQMLKAKS